MARWYATFIYRSQAHGFIRVAQELEELKEIHIFVERGPDFRTLEKIEITYIGSHEVLTLEEVGYIEEDTK